MYYQWIKRVNTRRFPSSLNTPYKRVAIKTNSDLWVGTQEDVIIMFSVKSAFHEGKKGILNMEIFISTLREHIQGKIIILMAERTHINAQSLHYNNDQEKAFEKAKQSAQELICKLGSLFAGCHIEFWHNFVNKDPHYDFCFRRILDQYEIDEELEQDGFKS